MHFQSSKKIIVVLFVLLLYGIPASLDKWQTKTDSWKIEIPVKEAAVREQNDVMFVESIVNPSSKYPVSHVSSVAWLGDGRVACVWYGGSKESAKDVNIYLSIYDEAKNEWSEERVLVSAYSSSMELRQYVRKVGNAVVFNDSKNRLWLFYVSIPFGGWSVSSLNYKVSLDQGETWTPSRKLILSPFINLSNLVKNKPVFLKDGRFLLPIYHELVYKFPEILLGKLDDAILRYKKERVSFQPGILQPAIFATDDERLIAFFRNASASDKKYVLRSTSIDSGATWSEPIRTTLPNPNSGFDLVARSGGLVVIVLNDTFDERSRLAIYTSTDYGNHWKKIKDLENTQGMEFSYPSIIRTPYGIYHITYTYNRKYIKHIAFSEAWLKKNEHL